MDISNQFGPMYKTFTSPCFQDLMGYVKRHQGYFTAQEASACGYSKQSQSYHVQQGHWERPARGIFRLGFYPIELNEWGDLMIAYLWSADREGSPQGVISHGTALRVWNLTTWTGPRIHMTVPPNFRRHSKCARPTELHFAKLTEKDYEWAHGFRITTPFRTIIDLLTSRQLEAKHLREGIEYGLKRGYITDRQIREAVIAPEERQLLKDLLRQINYAKIDEV